MTEQLRRRSKQSQRLGFVAKDKRAILKGQVRQYLKRVNVLPMGGTCRSVDHAFACEKLFEIRDSNVILYHGDGRIRRVGSSWKYDYYIKDHLDD